MKSERNSQFVPSCPRASACQKFGCVCFQSVNRTPPLSTGFSFAKAAMTRGFSALAPESSGVKTIGSDSR